MSYDAYGIVSHRELDMDEDFENLQQMIQDLVGDHLISGRIDKLVRDYVKKKIDEADFEGYKRGWEQGYSGCEFNRSSE